MSDDFIPFNQSTPIRGGWQKRSPNPNQSGYQNRNQSGSRRASGGFQTPHNKWGNNSQRNNSFGSDHSNKNRSKNGTDNINDYLHPAMLQDPWARFK